MLENSPECGKLSLNKEECQEAAQKLGLSFRVMNKGHAPNACHLDFKHGQFRTWWNEHTGIFGKTKYTTICKKVSEANTITTHSSTLNYYKNNYITRGFIPLSNQYVG